MAKTLEMEFNLEALSESEKRTMEQIEEDIITLLKNESDSEFIRFWEPEERIPDKEIEQKYKTIYSCGLSKEYRKKIRKLVFTTPIIAKNWLYMDNFLSNSAYNQLSLAEQQKLIIWSKDCYRILSKYFKDKLNLILKGVRFDFIPMEDGKYEVPYLPLCNVRLSKTNNGPIVSLNDYIADFTDLLKKVEEMQLQMKNAISKKENSPKN